MKYETGEVPQIGDVVRGYPEGSGTQVAGIVGAEHEGLLSVIVILAQDVPGCYRRGEAARFYGASDRFRLLARNP